MAAIPPRFSHPALAELVAQELRIPAFGVAIAGGTAAMGMSFALHEYLFPSQPTEAAALAGSYLVMQANGSRFDKASKKSHVVSTLSEEKAQSQALARTNQQKSDASAASLVAGIGNRRRATPDWMGHVSMAEKKEQAVARAHFYSGDQNLQWRPAVEAA